MKIAILMSGGIDSSFTALYLKERGYDVIGITFENIKNEFQKKAILRANEVAKALSIPHYVLDIQDIFEDKIIEPFCNVFKEGETPNPCPFCNKIVKFGLIFKKTKDLKIFQIATGHYTKVKYNEKTKRWILEKAKDKEKDQSYFLWQLSQEQLSRTIFPLGDFAKEEVKRRMQKRFPKIFNLKEYKESQNICFLRKLKLSDFLREKLKEKPGLILNLKGKIIGRHPGIHFFTIGQRSGLGIGAENPEQEPLYVIEIQRERDAIIVGQERHLFKKELEARDLNWVSIDPPQKEIRAKARIRYRHKEIEAEIQPLSQNKAKVIFKEKQRAITPGQHTVFYKKDLLLGGGIIDKISKN